MFKRNIFKILAIIFFLLAGATFYNSNKITTKKIISPTKIPTIIKGHEDRAPTNRLNPTLPAVVLTKAGSTISPTPIIIPTSIIKGSENPTPTNDIYNVSLSIGGSSVGSFDIPQNANQCDVLTRALSQGKIQSLNMRYNNDMGTNAVYQINGVGKENAVWWGFKVNGQSPSQGCSYIKVNNGDVVLWEYVGN